MEDGGYSIPATVSEVAAKEPGAWNRLELTVLGQRYVVVLNGRRVVDFTSDRGVAGHVGIQRHPEPAEIDFRRIACKALE